jgi:hypothetical protein
MPAKHCPNSSVDHFLVILIPQFAAFHFRIKNNFYKDSMTSVTMLRIEVFFILFRYQSILFIFNVIR